jgi:uncharacterized protein (TIGR02246 family)
MNSTDDNDDNLERAATLLLQDLESRWAAYDAEGFAASFDHDADFVDVLGRKIKGRDAIEQIHRRNFASIHLDSRIGLRRLAIRRLGEHTALVHVSGSLHVPAGPLAGDSQSTQTLVLVERDEGWRITAFHNTFVRDVPGAPPVDE